MSRKPAVPRQVRIIAGQWKRTPLPVPDVEGLRPTPDRVRETVFNWLEHLQQRSWRGRHCLDLFAGTGALGFEAASRGAESVLLVESDPRAIQRLEATRDKLEAANVRIQRGDAAQLLTRQTQKFHLIFLDPPYSEQRLPALLPRCQDLLAPGGLVYAESDQPFIGPEADEWMNAWKVVRLDKAGTVHFGLFALDETGSN
jgi:16S rRNA (guanine(966)-N(2))-methyltransferase RsmD